MLAVAVAIGPLSGRSWPDTPEEALANLIALICAVATGAGLVVLVGWFLRWWCFTNRPSAYRRRLEKRSAEFRARWPQEQLGYAPYSELCAEAQRCWALVFVLEDSDNPKEQPPGADSSDLPALHHWIDIVIAALNSAAERERQPATGRNSQ
ncbi:hypothetical protein [Mycobacterium sp. GA-1841]|uniref:hypothetical protein n=1 Tax=Mycobacterium sp. GA-1841 TaxID=1834154 RepID=UPI0011159665|nr:hypothetical protein [Mycobacterium sp. GA-1841]